LENGESVLSVSQLRKVAACLGLSPMQILKSADQYEAQLHQQGVDVIAEKPNNAAAIAIGLGLLTALLLSKR